MVKLEDTGEPVPSFVETLPAGVRTVEYKDRILYHADPNCEHDVQPQWSGVKCTKCTGWFCY